MSLSKSALKQSRLLKYAPLLPSAARRFARLDTCRRYLLTALVLVVILIGCAMIPPFVRHQNNDLRVREIAVSSDRIVSGQAVRIAHLSDLHSKQFGQGNSELLAKIQSLEPDLIVNTGDTLHQSGDYYEEIVTFFGQLTDIAPTVSVMGNHEPRTGKRADFIRDLQAEGIHFLDNEFLQLDIGGTPVSLLGIDERYFDRLDSRAHELLLQELSEMSGLRVVLSHYPNEFSLIEEDRAWNRFDFELMFAGHAHGGQWIVPGIGGLFAPEQWLFPVQYRGLYENRLVLSPGLGNSHFPLRLNNFPEIMLVEVGPASTD